MVFQQALLLKWRTILDNVLLPAEIVGLPMKAARIRARDLLNLVGLSGYEDKYPQQLSGGMQQRTAIARAFIHDPKLILMDEPFGALDALTREQMNLEMLKIWRESGKTIVFVTHSILEAVFLASHCAVLPRRLRARRNSFRSSCPFPACCRSRPRLNSVPMHGAFMKPSGSAPAPNSSSIGRISKQGMALNASERNRNWTFHRGRTSTLRCLPVRLVTEGRLSGSYRSQAIRGHAPLHLLKDIWCEKILGCDLQEGNTLAEFRAFSNAPARNS